jgi:3-dehydrosphinganine reductase
VRNALSQATAASGHIDVAICAAGRAVPKYFEDMTSADFEGTMRVNFLGTVHVAQAYLGRDAVLPEDSGVAETARKPKHFVAVSSVAAAVPFIGYADYAPSIEWYIK